MLRTFLISASLVLPCWAFASGTGTVRTCEFYGAATVEVTFYLGVHGDGLAVVSGQEIELGVIGTAGAISFFEKNTSGTWLASIDNTDLSAIGRFPDGEGVVMMRGSCRGGAE